MAVAIKPGRNSQMGNSRRSSNLVRLGVAKAYAAAIRSKKGSAVNRKGSSKRAGSCCSAAADEVSLAALAGYSTEALAALPADVISSSFGCGNPVGLAQVREGDTVLDLGSGAGMDLLLAARLAGPNGRAIGVDMTPAMIERARSNAEKAGLANVEIRKGIIEELPVENDSIDLVVSNCVVNLSPEKHRVFSEIFRVLKPGGRFSVSDIVSEPLPEDVRDVEALYSACISGAIPERDYLDGLKSAGLIDVDVADRMVYDASQLAGLLGAVDGGGCCCGGPSPAPEQVAAVCDSLAGRVATVRFVGRKPL